MTFMCVRCT